MTRAFLILLLSLTRCHAPATFAGTASFKGVAQFNQATGAPAFPQSANLTHYWNYDESSGTRLDTKGSVNMLVNGTVSTASGIKNTACYVNNGSNPCGIEADASPGMIMHNPASLMFWFKVSSWPGGILSGDIWSAVDDNNPFFSISSTDVMTIGNGADGNLGTHSYSRNTWHLVVVTNDASNRWKWYFDGTLLGDLGIVEEWIGAAIPILDTPTAYEAAVDEVATWSVELTAGEITTLWSSGAGVFWRP